MWYLHTFGGLQALSLPPSPDLEGGIKLIDTVLDRLEGKAVQRVEQKTIYAQMSKKELAALAYQKLLDAGIIATDGRVIAEGTIKLNPTENRSREIRRPKPKRTA